GPSTEAFRVDQALVEEFGRHSANHYLLFRDPRGDLLATDLVFRREVDRIVDPLRGDSSISGITTYGSTDSVALNEVLLSADSHSSMAIISLTRDIRKATREFSAFRDQIKSDRLEVLVGGWPATSKSFTEISERDLARAELISLPLTLLLLVLVFGSLVAAGLPLAVGIMAVFATLAGIGAMARFTETSVFAVNVASMIGLAIAIDYSLFLVSRFREELINHEVADALAITMATAGRAVLFSGLTVAIGIGGLAFFPTPALRTIGAGGALVVLLGVTFSLSFLVALLALLGPRVNRLRVRIPFGRRPRSIQATGGFWHQLAMAVMRRPLWFLIPTMGLLLVAGLPFRDIRGGSPGMTMLPRDQEPRQFYEAVQRDFPEATLSPIYVLVRPRRGAMTEPHNLAALRDLSSLLADVPDVRRVEGIWTYAPPGSTPELVAVALAGNLDLRRQAQRFLTPRASVLEIAMTGDDTDPAHEQLVRLLNQEGDQMAGGAFDMSVGGGTAVTVELVDTIRARAPLAVGFVLLVTYVVLFLLLGSVLLPLKAICLNLLSLTASYGALVWLFQEGHFAGLLDFEPLGYTVATIPVLMFCFVFGLSMDYEVLMLTRIKEEYLRTGDNAIAVARGLEATGRVVTSAALIMIVVFGSFGLSQLLLIKSLGIGQALAVAVDATLIRALLVPATMRLLGDWNWWAPAFLQRGGNKIRGWPIPATLGIHSASEGRTRVVTPTTLTSRDGTETQHQ
ncbi:MAG: MMPL family transporter, partial [Chloroflexia bacterium]|nr:MMPL family transporter [Chloroflexia bacterium]